MIDDTRPRPEAGEHGEIREYRYTFAEYAREMLRVESGGLARGE